METQTESDDRKCYSIRDYMMYVMAMSGGRFVSDSSKYFYNQWFS